MEKIINILCHPTYIVFYFKDQIYKIILFILSFFILSASILALYDYNEKYYDYEYVNSITETIRDYDKEIDLVFKDNKLEGSSYSISNNTACMIFLKDAVVNTEYGLFFIFKEDKVTFYYQGALRYDVTYESLNIEDFSFADIQANKSKAILNMNYLLDTTMNKANRTAQTFILISDLINLFFIYGTSVLLAIIISLFVNPAIEFKYRFRICLYDSIIFFIVVIFSFMFNISWLKYVAMVMPAFYARFSFKSIVRIR